MKVLLSIFLLMSLIACGGSKSENAVEGEEAGTEMADGEEFSDEFADEELGGETVAEGDAEVLEEDIAGDAVAEETTLDPSQDVVALEGEGADQAMEANTAPVDDSMMAANTGTSGQEGFHTVQRGETLMIIAFKIYGDYEKWRNLARWNANQLGPNYSLAVGQQLKYEAPAEKFSWNPEGNPYMIRVGDTLGTISRDTYGTTAHWKNIWDNNKPLIKNPNKIFAGFTIYTPLLESRGVANQDI